jgi:glycosyltransferase involved in cell wall biosynthesis/GT2 family glycosyltransferase
MINPQNPDFSMVPPRPLSDNFAPQLLAWNDAPILTIVTPFYNTGPEFHQTAQTIFYQSLQQWEWLIINDGSSDPTALKTLDEYRRRDPRIRIIDHAENRGLSAARNSGFYHARCEFVLLLDSDDLLEPTAAEKWWWFLETHPKYSFVASYHVAFGDLNYLWTGGFHDGQANADRSRVSMMCVVRKSVHKAVGGFDETIRGGLEDWEFWMRCAANGYWGATVPEYLAWYRVRQDHSDRWQNLQESRLIEFRSSLQNKYPNLYHGGFPNIVERVDYDLTMVDLEVPPLNQLKKTGPHLLIILPWLEMGGAERFTLNLIDQLIKQDWIIAIVTTAHSENLWLYEFEKRTPFIYILPTLIPIKEYPRFIGYLIQSRNIDSILIQGSQEGYRFIPALRMLFPKIPILDYLHLVTPDWMQGGFPKLSLNYQEIIDFTLTSCEQVRDWMIEAGANSEKIKTCYIGVDSEIWKPDLSLRERTRKEFGIGLNDTVILYAARLEEQKQPDMVVETLCKLKGKGVGFYTLVAGEGSLRSVFEEKLRVNDLQDRVRMLGSVPTETMPAIMAASDIFFLPSQNEGISQAIYEAMSCGLVVVGAQVGGQGELVSPECGFLLSPGKPENVADEYADVLYTLISDAPHRQQMSQSSRKRVLENFTISMMGECIQSKLNEVIENKKGELENVHTELDRRSIIREIQASVEYLQAMRELRILNQQYSSLIQPKTASHWFYLWIRQLFLPLSVSLKANRLGQILVGFQKWLKRALVKE